MRTLHATGFAAVLAATALAVPGGATAASPTTYSGSFSGEKVDYVNCTTTAPTNYATGDWSVTMHGASAKGDFTIMFGTETHVAYSFPGMKQAPGNTASNWVVYGKTMAGLLTVTVTGNDMTYVITPYNYAPDNLSCESATFTGTVDRD